MTRPPPRPPGPAPQGAQYLPPPQYPPGQPPLPPRRQPPRHSPVLAPVLALLGLLLVAGASIWGFSLLGDGSTGAVTGAAATSAPAGATSAPASASGEPTVVVAPTQDPLLPTLAPIVIVAPPGERPDIKGTILFSRDGDIWSASGLELRRLTGTNSDAAPTWSDNGKFIYFVRTSQKRTSNSRPGGLYTLFVPSIMRMNADGSNKKRIYNGFIPGPGGQWFSHVLQPDVSPDGKTIALVSDGPNGSADAITLFMLSSKPNSRLRKVTSATSFGSLGHNDPEWSADGRQVAYTRNRNAGSKGVPSIAILTCKSRRDCTSGKVRRLRSGYANPSWSPDGRWLAVEATRGLGRDIAIINSRRGDPRIVLTDDGNSFAPVVSPDGNQIAYLHRDGLKIDLRVMTLDIDAAGKITLVDDRAVTSDGAIDAESPPAWYIPKRELTPPPGPVSEGQQAVDSDQETAQSP